MSWECAHGDAPTVPLACAAVVAIAPDDDSVDSNSVSIVGSGSITSFGPCAAPVTKRVYFPSGVTIVNGPNLLTLTGADRTTTDGAVGTYSSAGDDVWRELDFQWSSVSAYENRINVLELQISELIERVARMERR